MSAMRTMGIAPVLPPDATVTRSRHEYVVSVPVTGFTRQELEVEIADHVVTVRGDQAHGPDDSGNFKLHEKIEESFRLPPDVDSDRVTARYGHQKLEIHAPRISTQIRSRRVRIERPSRFNFEASGV